MPHLLVAFHWSKLMLHVEVGARDQGGKVGAREGQLPPRGRSREEEEKGGTGSRRSTRMQERRSRRRRRSKREEGGKE